MSISVLNPKVGLTVSGSTVATGSATWLELVPTEIGFYASLIGIIVSLIIGYTTVRGGQLKRRHDRCSIELLEKQKEKLDRELEKMRNGKDV